MELKRIQVELKEQAGDFSAVFSTFNVIDLDGDVTLPGAFENGAVTRVLPAHNWGSYMIGTGTIDSDDEKAVVNGRFFLNTSEGKNWYESIKADKESGANLQEYSYGFDVLDSSFGEFDGREVRFLRKLKVHEVSPVTLGAGIGTHTAAIKAADEDDDSAKPLDDQSSDTAPDKGAATFAGEAEHVLADVQALAARAGTLSELRAKEGRTFSAANVGRLNTIADEIEGVSRRLRELLTVTEPKAVEAPAELVALYQRFQEQAAYYDRLLSVPA